MGVPRFFKKMLEKYPHTQFWNPNLTIDHFCMDFNGIIYNVFNSAVFRAKLIATPNLTTTKLENRLIKDVVLQTGNIINNIVRPVKSVYIAIDGSAPRGKMIQQRARRYKSLKEKQIKDVIKAKYPNLNEGKSEQEIENKNVISSWNASQNASPGTHFMKKLSVELQSAITKGQFSRNHPLQFIFSNTNVPGEAEHKYLPYIQSMVTGENEEDSFAIMSADADVIMLSLLQKKKNMYIFRSPDGDDPRFTGLEYIYLSIDATRDGLYNSLIENIPTQLPPNLSNKMALIYDYLFILFLAGNDFITPIPFLKLVNSGFETLFNIYTRILPTMKKNLIYYVESKPNIPQVNTEFFYLIMNELGKMEDFQMKKIAEKIQRIRRNTQGYPNSEQDENLSPVDKEWKHYENTYYYSPLHPDFMRYNPLFNQIDYMQPKHIWKSQYYHHFFHLNSNNQQQYNSNRSNICRDYLKALLWNLQYYLVGCPSWTWHYPYEVSPVPSDIAMNLHQMEDVNVLGTFEPSEPYKPFDQLMLILPKWAAEILPISYRKLMTDENSPLSQSYPSDFELDVITGGKFIYAEPILPDISDVEVMKETKKVAKKLTTEQRERNTLLAEPIVFNV
jgi:5'-3' exonuclease